MTTKEVANADALYKPFPLFSEWAKSEVDTTRWERYTERLKRRGEISPELLRKARDVVKRAAAVDTGAIEGLYEVDRGFTYTVATQAALWEIALDSKGQKVRALIESQLQAYEYVLDAATQKEPISEVWLRTLHVELCKAQDTYSVMTEVGPQVHRLPLGKYKHLPNHVRTAEGRIHSYAPVDLTPAEMHRLIEEMRRPEFIEAHPVLQASYAHYALTAIHPFADGNGRVARALGSVFTYRSNSFPLLILVEHREQYYHTLEAADRGEFQPFVDFVLERCLDAIMLVEESLQAAMGPQPLGVLTELRQLHTTKAGYSQQEVDEAGKRLLNLFREEFDRQAKELNLEQCAVTANFFSSSHGESPVPTHRNPGGAGVHGVVLNLESAAPVTAHVDLRLIILVPKDAGTEDDFLLLNRESGAQEFAARASELIPRPTGTLQMRISVAVQRMLGRELQKLVSMASEVVRPPASPS